VIESTEEAVLNSVCMAETMVGRDGHIAHALPLDRVAELVHRSR
jgi:D-aminopeptidase